MTLLLKVSLKIILFVALSKPSFVEGAVSCLLETDSSKDFKCIFIGVSTNETHPFFQPSFKHPAEVLAVEFESSKVPLLTDEVCKTFLNLQSLTMMSSFITRIEDRALSSCTNLTQFIIYGNTLTEVDSNMFRNNPELIEINFGFNRLTYVDVKLFEPTKKLVLLVLSSNLLVHFDFRGMPKLENLEHFNTSYNYLLDVDEFAVIERFPRLSKLILSNNLLECGNLKLMINIFEERNITFALPKEDDDKVDPRAKKGSVYKTRKIQTIICLEREEHLKATIDVFKKMRKANLDNCSTLTVNTNETQSASEEKLNIIIFQFVSSVLIIFCISMLIWHVIYWQRAVNSIFDDNAEYYYCYYDLANLKNENQ